MVGNIYKLIITCYNIELKGGLKIMEKPYRYQKKLVIVGNSFAVIVPKNWLQAQAKRIKIKDFKDVLMEVYKDKIVITPIK